MRSARVQSFSKHIIETVTMLTVYGGAGCYRHLNTSQTLSESIDLDSQHAHYSFKEGNERHIKKVVFSHNMGWEIFENAIYALP